MSKSYTPIQAFEAEQLSVDLLDKDFYMHRRRSAGSVIMQINSIRPTNSRIELTIGDVKMFGTYSVSYHALHHTGDQGQLWSTCSPHWQNFRCTTAFRRGVRGARKCVNLMRRFGIGLGTV